MSKEIREFKQIIVEIFNKIESEENSILEGAEIMTNAIMDGQVIHAIGTGGHSNIAAEELLWRAGVLVPINSMLEPGINLIHGGKRSNIIERTPGYGIKILDAYSVGKKEGEVIVIVNAYGINPLCIDIALESKKRNVKSIGVTSQSFAKEISKDHPSRHPSGKNLYEIVDIFIDNHLPLGDAVIKIKGCEQKVAPTSTLCNIFTLHCLIIEAVKKLVDKGVKPPVWKSANMPGGDEANKKYEEKYAHRIKHLW
jgi:uncharacterized phosphosugar-binding protein